MKCSCLKCMWNFKRVGGIRQILSEMQMLFNTFFIADHIFLELNEQTLDNDWDNDLLWGMRTSMCSPM